MAGSLGLGWGAAAQPADYPNRPIRIVSGFAAGGVNDVLARVVGQHLERRWGQPVVVDARPGASAAVAEAYVARSAPDGYTILIAQSNHATNQFLQRNYPLDAKRDFASIVLIGRFPAVLSAAANVQARSLPEVLDDIRSGRRNYTYGSSGAGGMLHLAGELLALRAGVELTHVPYRGGSAALNDLVAGQLPLQFTTIGLITPFHREGRVRSLAVAAEQRSPALPDVPTFVELGFPDVVVHEWYALVAPAGTPRPIIDKWNREVRDIMTLPDIPQRAAGIELAGGTPEDLDSFIQTEMDRWSSIIAAVRLTVD
ncbi:MAG TPA: tripartite tricarboxylate transporter substrate binding protein [Roseomonas sp.]